ncbi:MAG: SDR family NAD(P)-dependent oxidoreductase [Pseudomonadota bacterium]
MQKTLLITGATSGIGLEAGKLLAAQGHHLLLHGRNPSKAQSAKAQVEESAAKDGTVAKVSTFVADMSLMSDVESLANAILETGLKVDVLINNAGILKSSIGMTAEGLDLRFATNTFAPVLLTDRLSEALTVDARVVSLSSAAQAPVELAALEGRAQLGDQFAAYAQSKLALTMWSVMMGRQPGNRARTFIALNPGSLLATQMVKDGFGIAGKDASIGSEIIVRTAVSGEFEGASGKYFDNDRGVFSDPHRDALDEGLSNAVLRSISSTLAKLGHPISS